MSCYKPTGVLRIRCTQLTGSVCLLNIQYPNGEFTSHSEMYQLSRWEWLTDWRRKRAEYKLMKGFVNRITEWELNKYLLDKRVEHE